MRGEDWRALISLKGSPSCDFILPEKLRLRPLLDFEQVTDFLFSDGQRRGSIAISVNFGFECL